MTWTIHYNSTPELLFLGAMAGVAFFFKVSQYIGLWLDGLKPSEEEAS